MSKPIQAPPRTSRWLAGLAAAGVVATTLVAAALPASAAPNQYAPSIGTATGTLTVTPTNLPVSIKSDKLCPAGSGLVNGFLNSTDAGIVDGVVISANSTDLATLNTSGMPLDNNLVGLAQSAGRVLINGRYEVSVVCYPDAFSVPTAQFDAVFNVSGGVGAGAGTTATWEVSGPVATTTTISASPPATAVAGATVTLSATVSPAAAGTVQFQDVSAATPVNVGAAATVSAGGTASVTTTTLSVGAHSLRASFTPANPVAFAPSVSANLAYTITAAAATPTTTTISASPAATAVAGTAVQLTATVSPAAAVGSVQFIDGPDGSTVNVGSPVPVSGGVATASTTALAQGSHSLRAVFTPTNAADFTASTSAALAYTITAGQQPPTSTSTTLAASPSGTATAGDPVTFTATVAPADAVGTVQFSDTVAGTSTPLGAPVDVSAGTAMFSTSSLAVGSHSVVAAFVPADPALFTASFSVALPYTITPVVDPGAKPTTTTLKAERIDGWSGRWGHREWEDGRHRCGPAAELEARVRPRAAGTIQFMDTFEGVTTPIGAPVKVRNGRAERTVRPLGVGTHRFTAVFLPADPSAYQGSTSNTATVTIQDRGPR